MSCFGLSPAVMKEVWGSAPLGDLQAGVEAGRYRIGREQMPAMLALLSCATLAAMLPVVDGRGTWRDIGSDTAELILVALGIDRKQARVLARSKLPPLGALA